MAYQHFVAIKSVYSRGLRVAWHYSEESFDNKKVQTFLKRYKDEHGDLQLGIHRIVTEDDSWQSVVDSDDYFKTVMLFEKETDFLRVSKYDRKLKAVDIAKLILSIKPVTQLKLQKLVYFTYEKFLKQTEQKLFADSIYAWKHGPVVKNLYEEFREYGSTPIPYEEDDFIIISTNESSIKPIIMRVLSAEYGDEILKVVHSVIEQYGDRSAWDLVNETHLEGTPWKTIYEKDANHLITDELILAH